MDCCPDRQRLAAALAWVAGERAERKEGTSTVPTSRPKRPIRMRGYYRAVRRGEAWAVEIESKKEHDPLGYLTALVYRNVDFRSLTFSENPFLTVLHGPHDGFAGKYVPVPLKLG